MNPIVSFDFDQHAIRTIDRAGEPWFVAADVAAILGYRNAPDMVRNLDDDEAATHSVRSSGQNRDMTIICESGVYNAIFRSKRGEAQRFRRFVTGELLPTLRRTGQYSMGGQRAAQLEQSERTARRRELPGLMDRLELERNEEKRRVVHALIVKACVAEDIVPPAIEVIGQLATAVPDIVEPFWIAMRGLQDGGIAIDHSIGADTLAISLKEIAVHFRKNGVAIHVDRSLQAALRLSEQPRYLGYKTVNSAITRRSKACMVFTPLLTTTELTPA